MGLNQWSTQTKAVGSNGNPFGLQGAPAATPVTGGIFMAWEGDDGNGIYYSLFNPSYSTWRPQKLAVGPDGTAFDSAYPALDAGSETTITMAWKSGSNIKYSFYDLVNETWSEPVIVVDGNGVIVATVNTPAIRYCSTGLFMAWTGNGDENLWYSTYDLQQNTWKPQQTAGNGFWFGIQYSPAIEMFGIGLSIFVAWNGIGGDGIFYSFYDVSSGEWSPQSQAAYLGNIFLIGESPSLTTQADTIFMTWKDLANNRIWTSQYDIAVDKWSMPVVAVDNNNLQFGTQHLPALTSLDEDLFMAWNGVGSDGIFYSTITGLPTPSSDWMSFLAQNYPQFYAKSLRQMVLPGTHDSGMYPIGLLSWTGRTQDQPIYDQLMGGVRYFDLRPGLVVDYHIFKSNTYHYSCMHGSFVEGANMDDVLSDVSRYMSRPGGCLETVILKFSHYENFDSASIIQHVYTDFIDKVIAALGTWLYTGKPPGTRLADIPYSGLLGKVIIVCDKGYPQLYPRSGVYIFRNASGDADMAVGDLIVYDKYSDTIFPQDMKDDQIAKYNAYNGYSPAPGHTNQRCDLFLLSWTLTPPTDVHDFAIDLANPLLNQAIMSQEIPNQYVMLPNILYLDFYEHSTIMQLCYYLNQLPTVRLAAQGGGSEVIE